MPAFDKLLKYKVCFRQFIVVADDGHIQSHNVPELLMEMVGVFCPFHSQDLRPLLFSKFLFFRKNWLIATWSLKLVFLNVLHHFGSSDHSPIDCRKQRICSKTVCPMVLVFTFPRSKKPRNICHLVVIDPKSTHGIVNGRENPHWNFLWIITHELFIDFYDSA